MSKLSPRITMLATTDSGGAGGAAVSLLTALHYAGCDVRIVVLRKTTNNTLVEELPNAHKALVTNAALRAARLKAYKNVPSFIELFSFAESAIELNKCNALASADIIHFHWVAGCVDWKKAPSVFGNKPVVWTAHDQYPITGGCHYTAGCERYCVDSCFDCPQLGAVSTEHSLRRSDPALQGFSVKQDSYDKLNLAMVAPSNWLAKDISRSTLLGSKRCTCIPNPIDTHIFHPQPQKWARAFFGLPTERKIIAFGASGIQRYNKGFVIFKAALERLRSSWAGKLPLLLLFGGSIEGMAMPEGYDVCSLPMLNPSELAKVYAACDIFVSSSFQDVGPLTLQEAQATGTICLGMKTTGAEDIIADGKTGYLVEHPGLPIMPDGTVNDSLELKENVAVRDLAEKMEMVLSLPPINAKEMGKQATQRAKRKYAPLSIAKKYNTLYFSVVGKL